MELQIEICPHWECWTLKIFQRISNIQELCNLVSSWTHLSQGIPEVILKSEVRQKEMMGILKNCCTSCWTNPVSPPRLLGEKRCCLFWPLGNKTYLAYQNLCYYNETSLKTRTPMRKVNPENVQVSGMVSMASTMLVAHIVSAQQGQVNQGINTL